MEEKQFSSYDSFKDCLLGKTIDKVFFDKQKEVNFKTTGDSMKVKKSQLSARDIKIVESLYPEMEKPKCKEITMWAIWSPAYREIMPWTGSKDRKNSWLLIANAWGLCKKQLQNLGCRAVKGKFVWEEK